MTRDYAKALCLSLLLAGMAAGGCADAERRVPPRDYPMSSAKEIKSWGTPWENEFGSVQGVKAGSLIFVAGQLSLDDKGVIVGTGSMEAQMRQAYANIKKVLVS